MDTKQVLTHCLKKSEKSNCAIRLSIGPMPEQIYKLNSDHKFEIGKGKEILKGKDALLFTYGQTMIAESIKAAKY